MFGIINDRKSPRPSICLAEDFDDDMSTEEALRLSIEKWEFFKANIEQYPHLMDGGVWSCALCGLFYYDGRGGFCTGCPISEKTGDTHCQGSPYDAIVYRYENHEAVTLDEVQKEIDFLEILLAEELEKDE